MSAKLTGRRIVLTGISRGIGFEIAKRFLSDGAEILGVSRDVERLKRAAHTLASLAAGRLTTLALDVSLPESAAEIARCVHERWGALDVLINNAAIMLDADRAQGLLDEADDTLSQTLHANLLGPFTLARALVPLLKKGCEPRIVYVSSGAGTFAGLKESAIASYRLSKWAINGVTLLMARELSGQVAVNALDPGWVKTDLGGPQAPGSPVDSAEGAFALVTAPFSETGKLWKDGEEIPF